MIKNFKTQTKFNSKGPACLYYDNSNNCEYKIVMKLFNRLNQLN